MRRQLHILSDREGITMTVDYTDEELVELTSLQLFNVFDRYMDTEKIP